MIMKGDGNLPRRSSTASSWPTTRRRTSWRWSSYIVKKRREARIHTWEKDKVSFRRPWIIIYLFNNSTSFSEMSHAVPGTRCRRTHETIILSIIVVNATAHIRSSIPSGSSQSLLLAIDKRLFSRHCTTHFPENNNTYHSFILYLH